MFCPLFGIRKKDPKPPLDYEDLEVPLLIPIIREGVKIVGFTGKAGAGKDTAADYLKGYHGYEKHAFAGPLKRAVSVLFGIDLLTLNDPIMKEVPDKVWRRTPRYLMQWLGTDALRKEITDDFFVISMARAIDDSLSNLIVISDVRFDDEARFVKKMGGTVIRIERPGYDNGLSDARKAHASEHGVSDSLVDGVIVNGGDEEDLTRQLDSQWFTDLLEGRSQCDELSQELSQD